MASARITVERGVVGFGLDYACAHIIIQASVNLLPIQADFVTERDTRPSFPPGAREGLRTRLADM